MTDATTRPYFTRNNVALVEGGHKRWPLYRKHALTHATRIHGPFVVETCHGHQDCLDGYLCVDERGYPYAVATDEFNLIYHLDDGNEDRPETVQPSGGGVETWGEGPTENVTAEGEPMGKSKGRGPNE